MTRVSIGMPTYNRASHLDETLESLLAQDWPDLEIVIIDDGSIDDTPRVLERWKRRSGCIQVLRQINKGEAAACNAAWQRATGALFCVVNSDDPQPPELVRRSVAFLAQHPEVVMSYPDWWRIGSHGERLAEIRRPDFSLVHLIGLAQNVVGPGAFIRRDRVFGCMPVLRDTRYRYVSDYYMALMLADLGPFGHLPETIAAWRDHPGGATNVHHREMLEELVLLLKRYWAREGVHPDTLALRSMSLANAHAVASIMLFPAHPLQSAWHALAALPYTAPADSARRLLTIGTEWHWRMTRSARSRFKDAAFAAATMLLRHDLPRAEPDAPIAPTAPPAPTLDLEPVTTGEIAA